jgi:ribosomal protein S18 acetylase RimI-like enzyme
MANCDEIFHLRRAREADAPGIAQVHVQTWRDAYRDQLPAEFLAGLSVDNRERMWRNELKVLAPDRRPWVAETSTQIIGFVSAGHSRGDDAKSGEGEVYAIYVLPDCWTRGIGRNLLTHAERDLIGHGYSEAVLWCFEDNLRARDFYERSGWHADGASSVHTYAGVELTEIRYRKVLASESLGAIA